MKHLIPIATSLLMLAAATRGLAGETTPEAEDGGTFYSPLPKSVQEDLGDLRPVEASPFSSYFHGQASVSTQYTSNGALYHSRDDADFLISPLLQGGFTAPITKQLTIDLEGRMEDFTYSSSNDQKFGFWGFSGSTYLDYRYKPTWPRIYVGTEPYYYISYQTGNWLTEAIGPVAGIDQSVSLNRGKTLLYAGYHFGQYFASPAVDTRASSTVTLSVTQQLLRNLYAQAYWQLQYSDYEKYGRDETRDVVGVSFIRQLNEHMFGSLFVNYVDNASNNSLAKYETLNAGVSLVLQY